MKFDKVFRGTWNDKRSELHSSNLSCRWVKYFFKELSNETNKSSPIKLE